MIVFSLLRTCGKCGAEIKVTIENPKGGYVDYRRPICPECSQLMDTLEAPTGPISTRAWKIDLP